MAKLTRYLGQVLALGVFGLTVAVFSDTPAYTHLGAGQATVTLSLVHSAKRAGECRRRTAEELAKMAPNMRNPLDCPRGRVPIVVELEIDGNEVLAATAFPSGLAGDGPSRIQQRFVLPVGPHHLTVRMRDTARATGFDYQTERTVNLVARQNLVIDFKAEAGGLIIQ